MTRAVAVLASRFALARRRKNSTILDVRTTISGCHCLWQSTLGNGAAANDPTSAADADDYKWPNVYDEAHELMMASYISYPLSFLIREAKRGHLKDSEAVLQTLQTIRDGDLDTTLHPSDVKEIVLDNIDYVSRHPQNNLRDKFGWYAVLETWEKLERDHPDSLELLEFDDHGDDHRLVYGIVVNKIRRRITVIFRGTYAEETDDWKRNLEFDQVAISVPFNLRPMLGKSTMRVHQGMYNYLFENADRGPRFEHERYEEILQHLEHCIQRFPGFKVYVSGHSAGGALAKLFGFYLATSRLHGWNIAIPKPISIVCFGSLCLGDLGFQRAFHLTEKLGWVRHLRIINEGDPVCYLPPLIGYAPSGMHLQLHRDGGHSLWYPNGPGNNTWSGLMQVLRNSIIQSTDLFEEHMVPAYLRRLEREREPLQQVTLNEVYRNYNSLPSDSMKELGSY